MKKCIDWLGTVYGLDEKTIWRHLKDESKGRFLGVGWKDGQLLVEGIPGVQSPLPAEAADYVLPRGTRFCYPEPISGAVSSQIFQGPLHQGEKYTLVQELAAVSGQIVEMHVYPAWSHGAAAGEEWITYEYKG